MNNEENINVTGIRRRWCLKRTKRRNFERDGQNSGHRTENNFVGTYRRVLGYFRVWQNGGFQRIFGFIAGQNWVHLLLFPGGQFS